MSRPLGKPRCPCCGHVALTDAEERVLAALATAPRPSDSLSAQQLTGLAGVAHVRRVLTELKRLGLAELAGKQRRFAEPPRNLFRATAAGKRACLVLAGRSAAE